MSVQFNLPGFGGSYFTSHTPFMRDISPSLRNCWHMDGTCLSHPLAAKITCDLVLCPICYQVKITSEFILLVSSPNENAQRQILKILRCSNLVFSSKPKLILTYFKTFHYMAPACLNSLIYEFGPTLFYLFITSRFDKNSFSYLLHRQEVRLAYGVCLVFEISQAWDLHVF